MHNVNRSRLRAHTLKVESTAWAGGSASRAVCNRCSCQEMQREVHALLFCQDPAVCALRIKYSYLFVSCFPDFSVDRPYLLDMVPNQRIFDFLSQHHNKLLCFLSDLMDFFLAGRIPICLADGQLLSCQYVSLPIRVFH